MSDSGLSNVHREQPVSCFCFLQNQPPGPHPWAPGPAVPTRMSPKISQDCSQHLPSSLSPPGSLCFLLPTSWSYLCLALIPHQIAWEGIYPWIESWHPKGPWRDMSIRVVLDSPTHTHTNTPRAQQEEPGDVDKLFGISSMPLSMINNPRE